MDITYVAGVGVGLLFVGLIALLMCVFNEDLANSFTARFGHFLTLLGLAVWLGMVTYLTVNNEVNTTKLIVGALSEEEIEAEEKRDATSYRVPTEIYL